MIIQADKDGEISSFKLVTITKREVLSGRRSNDTVIVQVCYLTAQQPYTSHLMVQQDGKVLLVNVDSGECNR